MSDPAAPPRWLSLGPASRLVGVDPDTLRRWADDGQVEAYATPGGHRRFDRRTLERLASTRRTGSRPLASLGASPERLARAYRRSYTTDTPANRVPVGDAVERERYRVEGRRLATSGTSLTEAVALFVAARRPFLDGLTGLGRRRALDAARLAALYENASGLLDRLLLRLVATYQEAAA